MQYLKIKVHFYQQFLPTMSMTEKTGKKYAIFDQIPNNNPQALIPHFQR